MDAVSVLPALSTHAKKDITFVPLKDKGTERWHVTAQSREFELLLNGPKFYDTRAQKGGGGAIDLAMHLLNLGFKQAVERLRISQT